MQDTMLDWDIAINNQRHTERVPFMRLISYEVPACPEKGRSLPEEGHALSMNISSGGLLILIDRTLELRQVIKVHIPSIANVAQTPTLVEVCWLRQVPWPMMPLYLVGVKFVL